MSRAWGNGSRARSGQAGTLWAGAIPLHYHQYLGFHLVLETTPHTPAGTNPPYSSHSRPQREYTPEHTPPPRPLIGHALVSQHPPTHTFTPSSDHHHHHHPTSPIPSSDNHHHSDCRVGLP